jgi:flagellar motor switch protein FliG
MGKFLGGISAYRKVLEQKNAPPEELPGEAPPGEDIPGLLKTGRLPAPLSPVPGGDEKKPDSKYRRVAKFLILIGSEEASRILAQLEPEQVEEISREIALIRKIGPEEAALILEEFRSLIRDSSGRGGASQGGVEAARELLYAAFGAERGEALLRKTVPGGGENVFSFLEDFSPEQLVFLFREESAAAAALVLSRLPPALSAGVLARTPPERKLEIARRIAKLGYTGTEVLDRVAEALREKARHLGRSDKDALVPDGMSALTAILKHSQLSFGDRILEELQDKDPELGRDLKERLYTLEDLVDADDRPVQAKLRELSDRDIVLILKGRSKAFEEKIYANISAARRAQIREEAEILGPVLKKDADAAAGDFLAWFRKGREDGTILLLNSEDVVV